MITTWKLRDYDKLYLDIFILDEIINLTISNIHLKLVLKDI